ncbi:MAG TPA: hypothetical protein VNL69_02760 [Bacteroidota bacterium]|nr:hypothetical protein [Bacteroidota bacterium]
MKRNLLVLVIAVSTLACEHVLDSEPPYEPRIVVYGSLEWGIRFSRILRLNEEVDVRRFLFPRIEVEGYVADDRSRQPLIRRGEGFYTCALLLVDGETYTLFATWEGKRVTARVTKPHSPRIDTLWGNVVADSNSFTFTWNLSFVPRAGEGYRAIFGALLDTSEIFFYGVDSLTIVNAGTDGRIRITASQRSSYPPNTRPPRALTARVVAYDWNYFQYYISLPREGGSLPLYVISGGPLESNVEGDGVGIVWSESASQRTYPLQP